MYRCQKCGRQTKANEPCNIVVVATRPKEYIRKITKGMGENKYEKEIKSAGHEIAKTEFQCNQCCQLAVETHVTTLGLIQETTVNVK